jgi:hypothetical protein
MDDSLKKVKEVIAKKYPPFDFTVFHDTPITLLKKPLNECKLVLLTTGGLHLKTDIPRGCYPCNSLRVNLLVTLVTLKCKNRLSRRGSIYYQKILLI